MTIITDIMRTAKGRKEVLEILAPCCIGANAFYIYEETRSDLVIEFALQGVRCTVFLDAREANGGVFSAHWSFSSGRQEGRLFDAGFENIMPGKPDDIAQSSFDTLGELYEHIRGQLQRIAAGDAFEKIAA